MTNKQVATPQTDRTAGTLAHKPKTVRFRFCVPKKLWLLGQWLATVRTLVRSYNTIYTVWLTTRLQHFLGFVWSTTGRRALTGTDGIVPKWGNSIEFRWACERSLRAHDTWLEILTGIFITLKNGHWYIFFMYSWLSHSIWASHFDTQLIDCSKKKMES